MAQLRYNAVAAPDFSGAQRGIESASAMINRALSGAQEGLQQFDNIQTEKVNKAFAAELLKYQDPEAYKQALASGAVFAGFDRDRLSADMLNAAGSRSGVLLNQAQTEFQLGRDKRLDAREQMVQAARDAASPFQQQMLMLSNSGDLAGAQKVYADNKAVFDKLGYADFSTTMRDAQGLAEGRQRYDQSGTRFGWDSWRFGNEKQDYALNKEATAAAYEIGSNYMDNDSRIAAITAKVNSGEWSPEKAAAVRSRLGIGYDVNLADYADPNGWASGAGGGATDAASVFSRMIGAESSGNQFAANGAPLTSSKGAIGIAQVMPGTAPEAARLAGLPWDEKRYKTDAAYNRAIGEAYFQKQLQTFGGNTAMAVAAYNAGPGNVQKAIARGGNNWASFVPDETKAYLQKVLGGSTAGGMIAQATQAAARNTNIGAAQMETFNGSNIPVKFGELAQSTETPRQVAARLAKENPGVNAAWLEGQILKYQSKVANGSGSRRNVNAAVVGQALMDRTTAQSNQEGWYNPKRWFPDSWRGNTIGEDLTINEDAVLGDLNAYSKGMMDTTIAANTARAAGVQVNQQAMANAAAMQARLEAKVRAAQARGMANPLSPRELQDLAVARQIASGAAAELNTPVMQLEGYDTNRPPDRRTQADVAVAGSRLRQQIDQGAAKRLAEARRVAQPQPKPAPAPAPQPRPAAPQQQARPAAVIAKAATPPAKPAPQGKPKADDWEIQRKFWGGIFGGGKQGRINQINVALGSEKNPAKRAELFAERKRLEQSK